MKKKSKKYLEMKLTINQLIHRKENIKNTPWNTNEKGKRLVNKLHSENLQFPWTIENSQLRRNKGIRVETEKSDYIKIPNLTDLNSRPKIADYLAPQTDSGN